MGKRARLMARQETAPGQRATQSPFQDVSRRCRATHDVPYVLRCTLMADGHSIHKDKNGGTWK